MSTWVEILRHYSQLPPSGPPVVYVTQAQYDQIRAAYPDDPFIDEQIAAGNLVIL